MTIGLCRIQRANARIIYYNTGDNGTESKLSQRREGVKQKVFAVSIIIVRVLILNTETFTRPFKLILIFKTFLIYTQISYQIPTQNTNFTYN